MSIFSLKSGYNKLVDRLFEPTNRSIYLSIFRVYVAFHIIKNILFQWPYLGTLYGTDGSFVVCWSDKIYGYFNGAFIHSHYLAVHLVYLVLLGFMLCGIGKRATIFAVFVITDVLQHTEGFTLDGGDNLLKFYLLYMSFCDSFRYLSITKMEPKRLFWKDVNALLTNLGVLSIITHLLVVYLISGVAKIRANVWYDGTAVYYIMANDRFAGTRWNIYLVQNAYFVMAVTYATVVWEATFPFFVLLRRTRIWCLLCGTLLHVGIYIFMMINAFEVLFMASYGFFFTDDELRNFARLVKNKIEGILPNQFLHGRNTREDIAEA